MRQIAETADHKIRLVLEQDEYPINPREEEDNLGTMTCWHRRYVLGDKDQESDYDSWLYARAEEFLGDTQRLDNRLDREGWGWLEDFVFNHREMLVALPLFLYDHSGITMSTSSGRFRAMDSYGWDWGKVGWIWCTRAQARKWFSVKRLTKRWAEQAEKELHQEVQTYDAYLRGDIYEMHLIQMDARNVEGDTLDSCGGIYYSGTTKEFNEHLKEIVGPQYASLVDELEEEESYLRHHEWDEDEEEDEEEETLLHSTYERPEE